MLTAHFSVLVFIAFKLHLEVLQKSPGTFCVVIKLSDFLVYSCYEKSENAKPGRFAVSHACRQKTEELGQEETFVFFL